MRHATCGDIAQKNAEAYSVHISTILREEATETKFLVPGCIPRGNIVLLSGASGSRKSWLAYDLARAVAQGRGWLEKDMPCPDGPLPVVLLNYDNPTETLRTRLKKLNSPKTTRAGFTRSAIRNRTSQMLLECSSFPMSKRD